MRHEELYEQVGRLLEPPAYRSALAASVLLFGVAYIRIGFEAGDDWEPDEIAGALEAHLLWADVELLEGDGVAVAIVRASSDRP